MKKLLLLLLLPLTAFGQGVRYDTHVWTGSSSAPFGAAAPIFTTPGAQITVCGMPQNGDPCTNVVNVFADQAMQNPLPQPLTADALGQFGFYAPAGNYVYSIQTPDGQSQGTFPLTLAGNPANIVSANFEAGSDLGSQITLADAQLGANSGTIEVYSGTISTVPTISASRVIHVRGPINWNVSVPVKNNFALVCDGPAAVITEGISHPIATPFTDNMIVGTNTTGLSVQGCVVKQADPTQNKVAMVGALPASNVDVSHNYLTNVALLSTNGVANSSLNIKAFGNSDTFTDPTGTMAGINLFFAKGVTLNGNYFNGTGHGVQWWGGDSNGGWTGSDGVFANGSYLQVNAAGDMTIDNTTCQNVGGACVWGSMGYNIAVTGGTCDGAGDICWDSEGGYQNTFTNVNARNFGNFCGAVFFQSKDVTFDNLNCEGFSSNIGVQFVVKHASGSVGPNHDNVVLKNSTFFCPGYCVAVYTEGYQHLVVENNHFTNGVFDGVNFNYNLDILNNEFRFDTTSTPNATVGISVPTPLGKSIVNVRGNRLIRMAPSTGSICLTANWQDFNEVEFYNWEDNECKGWDSDLITNNLGQNVGPTAYPRMIQKISRNYFHDGVMAHTLGVGNGTNDSYNVFPDNLMDVTGTSSIKPLYGIPMPNNMQERVVGQSVAATGGGTALTNLTLPLPLGDSNALSNGTYRVDCTIGANSGAPQVKAASVINLTTISVTTQAITSTAAQGTLSCIVTH